MYAKFIWIAFITVIVLIETADGKKSRKTNSDVEFQPNMTYSTFGFSDVGSYDVFAGSPDFPSYHTSNNQDSQMRLYAPAFPSAIDSTGLGYDPSEQSSFSTDNEEQTNANINTFQPVQMNFFPSSYDSSNERNTETKEIFELHNDNMNLPTYGTKIGSKVRNKPAKDFNNTEYNILDSVTSVIDNNYNTDHTSNVGSIQEIKSTEHQNIDYPSLSSSVSFPKVVDFTNAKKYYPTSVESKYTNLKPVYLNVFENNEFNNNDNNKDNRNVNELVSYKNQYNGKGANEITEKEISQVSFLSNQDSPTNYSNVKDSLKINKYKPEYKDKLRTKYIYNNDESNKLRNPMKGYDYSTGHSTASLHFDYNTSKRPFNSSIDEISPQSSNLNFVDYRYPEKEFTDTKTLSTIKFNTDNSFSLPDPDTYQPSQEYLNAFKNYYSAIPSTASHWENIYAAAKLKSPKKKPQKTDLYDEDSEDIVHIPKRLHSSKYGNHFEGTLNEWPNSNEYKTHIPSITKQPEWTKDFIRNKYKTEEDLLGLRNQDDLSSSYLNSFKYNDLAKDFDYDKLSEKWRQSYLRSKIKDSNRDYENYPSDTKQIHVPRPKPYMIEIPHPVIVPVPQQYPVRVPIPKPVVVPVIQELTVPVEKPMLYPIIKKVPYLVERLVPVPVEKQVRVPVVKPYPVHVPQVRPVFHHSKHEDEDEYEARPDTRRPVHKRPQSTRSRPRPTTRRPTRMAYRDNQRHQSRRPVHKKRPRRPNYPDHSRYEDYEDNNSEYERYCKRTGNC